jgi:hypothetical protein
MALLNCYLSPIIFNSNVFKVKTYIINDFKPKVKSIITFLYTNKIINLRNTKIFLKSIITKYTHELIPCILDEQIRPKPRVLINAISVDLGLYINDNIERLIGWATIYKYIIGILKIKTRYNIKIKIRLNAMKFIIYNKIHLANYSKYCEDECIRYINRFKNIVYNPANPKHLHIGGALRQKRNNININHRDHIILNQNHRLIIKK